MKKSEVARDLSLSVLEEVLLYVLRGRERYGLEILTIVNEAHEGKRVITIGSLYPTLHRLERKGFVRARWGQERPEERGGARRRYYKITGLGERALREKEHMCASLTAWQPALEKR